MNELIALLSDIRPEFDFTSSANFIADGMLDSFDVISLVAALDKHYGISIDGTDIVPDNFRSIDTISGLLKRYQVAP